MGWVFDTHPADSRVVGPVKVAGCVVARYGTGGGNTPMVVDVLCRASTQGGRRKPDEHGNDTDNRP